MAHESLPKAYDPHKTEDKWSRFWEEGDFFAVDPSSEKEPYCIVIPPPNVTGTLHMGHALTNTLQDVLIRWKRMSGFEALWVPGTDHAGIATQTVVERHLMNTEGRRRKEYPREEFLNHIWEWKDSNENRIINQLKRLGCSCDWSRQRFTMDDGCNASVRAVFKRLYDEGLIYRGDYLVNWDPVTQTALADDEVEDEEKASSLWYFKYPFADGSGHAVVATTRPETMLGDTAVAVSPSDERYAHLIGENVILPLVDRPIPIIGDHRVDPEFGTGMVKTTPSHDPNDYLMGLEHDLEFINIMTPDGHINENGGKFKGMSMEEARGAVVAAMKDLGLLEKIEPHTHRVGISYRSKAVIEPYMSKQWFIKMEGFAKTLKTAVEEDHVSLIPETWKNTYFHWVDNLRDWCISRQLWWGHRIPIWYHVDDPETIICYDGEGLPPEVEESPDEWRQDEDVLDTWFSSAFWPFSALGWPEKTPEVEKFYPNDILITGHDILFFWVARMIAMGKYALGEFPFGKVFLHGLIYGKSYWRKGDKGAIQYVSNEERIAYDSGESPIPADVEHKWEKMSKSKGNIIDPLELIELYGTDAIRMTLCATPSQLREIDLDIRKFEEYKNFANKVWNGARFIFMHLDGNADEGLSPLSSEAFASGLDMEILSLEDRWMLSTLNRVVGAVNGHLDNLAFDHAAIAAYDFFWKEFCAYYLEIVKPVLYGKEGSSSDRENKQKILAIVLCTAIRLLHPITPFITEELFMLMKKRLGVNIGDAAIDVYTKEALEALYAKACVVAPYPSIIDEKAIDATVDEAFAAIKKVVYTIRNIRGEMKLPPGTKTDVFIVGADGDPLFSIIRDHKSLVTALVPVKTLEICSETPEIPFTSTGIVDTMTVVIPMPEELRDAEKKRLEKEKIRVEKSLERTRQQLANTSFIERAPKELVEKQRDNAKALEAEYSEITEKLKSL
ncbi:MAG: valine--tRNA ligase [Waddliaceae bacterium]|nr:valine--tRNA ligase [Waddliaceae bacterium]